MSIRERVKPKYRGGIPVMLTQDDIDRAALLRAGDALAEAVRRLDETGGIDTFTREADEAYLNLRAALAAWREATDG